MKDEKSILGFLGLAAKAGKVISGFDRTVISVRNGQAKLLILAQDISRNTLSDLMDIISREDLKMPPAISFGSQYKLGCAIGKPSRAVMAVTDEGFARRLCEMTDEFKEDNH